MSLTSLDCMRTRLLAAGGLTPEERMIEGKKRTLQKALHYSYQANSRVCRLDENNNFTEYHRALINPDKLEFNHDNKILSVEYEFGYKAGDILHWASTDSYWLVYLESLTEDAYFKAQIRRCKYLISWVDIDTKIKHTSWAYVRGPDEESIGFKSNATIQSSTDITNETLMMFVSATPHNLKFFKRYSTFMLNDTTWEIQVVDTLSAVGVIKIMADEYSTNNLTSDVEGNLVNAFQYVPVIEPTPTEEFIIGDNMIKPTFAERYSTGISGGTWSFTPAKAPIKITEDSDNNIELLWTEPISGQFKLIYTTSSGTPYEKTIIVESLF